MRKETEVMILKTIAKAWKKPSFAIPKKPTYLEHPTYIRELVFKPSERLDRLFMVQLYVSHFQDLSICV